MSSTYPKLLLLPFLAVGGCSSGETSASGDDIDTATESKTAASRGNSSTTVSASKSITELFVHEDPTIDPSKTAQQNADAVATELKNSVSACPSAKITHATGSVSVSVDFGTGCTIPSVSTMGTISGSASVTVAKTTAISLSFAFTKLTVNGMTLDGTATESTTNGTTYTSDVDLTEGTNHVTYKGTLALDVSMKGVTLTGAGTFQSGTTPAVNYTLNGVHHLFGACYADAGTMGVTKPTTTKRGTTVNVVETIAFDASTPSTGKVTVTVNGASSSLTLPAYGSCPHA